LTRTDFVVQAFGFESDMTKQVWWLWHKHDVTVSLWTNNIVAMFTTHVWSHHGCRHETT